MKGSGRLAVATLALLATAGTVRAQAPTIAELEAVALQREREIARLETRLRALDARQDSLVRVKLRTQPGSAQFETVSNAIRENSARIEPVRRDVATHTTQLRSLKTELYQRYNTAIGSTNQRIEELKAQGRTTRNSAEMRQLVDRLGGLIERRQTLSTELEGIEEELYLPELVYFPTDSPRDLRRKEAQARDAVALIEGRVQAIEEQIEDANRTLRMAQEVARVRRDIELWGDDRGAGDELEVMLEQRPGRTPRGQENPFGESPEERIRRLQRRRLELLDLHEDYRAKVELFAVQQREFYP